MDAVQWPGDDEVLVVLAALRTLIGRSSIPVVRACLEEAHDDIAHLTGRDEMVADFDDEADAA